MMLSETIKIVLDTPQQLVHHDDIIDAVRDMCEHARERTRSFILFWMLPSFMIATICVISIFNGYAIPEAYIIGFLSVISFFVPMRDLIKLFPTCFIMPYAYNVCENGDRINADVVSFFDGNMIKGNRKVFSIRCRSWFGLAESKYTVFSFETEHDATVFKFLFA